MSYRVLARKYRPLKFSEVVGQKPIVTALGNSLRMNRIHHAMLFSGTRGVGKTSFARIVAAALNCQQDGKPEPCGQCKACQGLFSGNYLDFLEIDGASKTKVEDIRDLLENIPYAPALGRYKIYLIDEVHMLSTHSFNALLKSLEEPPDHLVFLLATTEPEKIPATVLSRCLQLRLRLLEPEKIEQHLIQILKKEGILCEEQAIKWLANAARGSMRDALSLLDQSISHADGTIRTQDLVSMLGLSRFEHIKALMLALKDKDIKKILAIINELSESGSDFETLLDQLLYNFHEASILQKVPDYKPSNEAVKPTSEIKADLLQFYYQATVLGKRDFHLIPEQKSAVEMLFLRMLAFTLDDNPKPALASNKSPENRTEEKKPHASIPSKAKPSPAASKDETAPMPESTNVSQHLKPQKKAQVTKANDAALQPSTRFDTKMSPEPKAKVVPKKKGTVDPVWLDFALKTKLAGVAKRIAMHSVPKNTLKGDEDEIHLLLDRKKSSYNTKAFCAGLEEALKAYFKCDIKLSVELSSAELYTPQDEQEQSIRNDPTVCTLRDAGYQIESTQTTDDIPNQV